MDTGIANKHAPRERGRRAGLIVLSLLAAGAVPVEPREAQRPADRSVHSLDEIVSELEAWGRSFTEIRLVGEATVVRSTADKPFDPNWWTPPAVGSKRVEELTWAADGRCRLGWLVSKADGTSVGGELHASDGTTSFGVRFPAGTRSFEEPVGVVTLTDGSRYPDRYAAAKWLDGLFWPSELNGWPPRVAWLPAVLRQPGRAALTGDELVDGVRCPRVRVLRKSGMTDYPLELVLDPRRRFLPRVVRTGGGEVIVDAFDEIAPGLPWYRSGRSSTRFVDRGVTYEWDEEWQISEASAGPLPAGLFRPPVGPRVQVVDRRARPYVPPPPRVGIGWRVLLALVGLAAAPLAVWVVWLVGTRRGGVKVGSVGAAKEGPLRSWWRRRRRPVLAIVAGFFLFLLSATCWGLRLYLERRTVGGRPRFEMTATVRLPLTVAGMPAETLLTETWDDGRVVYVAWCRELADGHNREDARRAGIGR